MLDKQYFRTIRTRADFEQADRSGYGPKTWGHDFPLTWEEHASLIKNAKIGKEQRGNKKRTLG